MFQQHACDVPVSNFTFQQITDAHKPADDETVMKRSLFFCHSVHAHIRQNLANLVNRAKTGEFGLETRESVDKSLDDWTFGEALKELTSTAIHVTGLLQGGPKAPIWLIRFLFESQQETDSIFPEPSVQEIIERRGSMSPRDMLEDLVVNVSQLLGLPENSKARQSLRQQIENSQPFVNELLLFALTQPAETLNAHLAKYV